MNKRNRRWMRWIDFYFTDFWTKLKLLSKIETLCSFDEKPKSYGLMMTAFVTFIWNSQICRFYRFFCLLWKRKAVFNIRMENVSKHFISWHRFFLVFQFFFRTENQHTDTTVESRVLLRKTESIQNKRKLISTFPSCDFICAFCNGLHFCSFNWKKKGFSQEDLHRTCVFTNFSLSRADMNLTNIVLEKWLSMTKMIVNDGRLFLH